ncbi:hypothetical protein GGS20DRAFT_599560 [Poronia punctata]|nr:hypothetical protein GGS20DRAFT_599560 [Poronia punctata]
MAVLSRGPGPRHLALLAGFLFLLYMWYSRLLASTSLWDQPSTTHEFTETSNPATHDDIQTPPTDKHKDLSSPHSQFVSWPLHRLCTEQSPSTVPGLIFLCDNNSGGPGNIRNYILTCLRYAIEAGASGILLPRIRVRAVEQKADLFRGGYRGFGYMFDERHFRDAWGIACPHIKIYPEIKNSTIVKEGEEDEEDEGEGEEESEDSYLLSIPNLLAKSQRENLSPSRMVRRIKPKDYGGSRAGCDDRDPNRHTDRFGDAFREYLTSLPHTSEDDNPTLIRLSWGVLWDWPIFRDGPEMAASFGVLLRPRRDILHLADHVVSAMREFARKEGEEKDAMFLGVHLRTEEDALSQWPTYEMQSEGYFRAAEDRGFSGGVAYLASGSEEQARKFAGDAQTRLQMQVKSKYNLVHGPELDKLKGLSWDQQALVDFAILLQSDYFVGVSPSSFSINVALKRHLQKDGLYTRPWKVGWSDGRSWLVGKYEKYWDDWLFMFDGMWP